MFNKLFIKLLLYAKYVFQIMIFYLKTFMYQSIHLYKNIMNIRTQTTHVLEWLNSPSVIIYYLFIELFSCRFVRETRNAWSRNGSRKTTFYGHISWSLLLKIKHLLCRRSAMTTSDLLRWHIPTKLVPKHFQKGLRRSSLSLPIKTFNETNVRIYLPVPL